MKRERVTFVSKDKNKFYKTLRSRVDNYFVENGISKHGNWKMVLKSVIMLSFFIFPFLSLLYFQPGWTGSIAIWFTMGLAMAGIGMSIMHDAIHNAYSSSKFWNNLFGYTLNLVGASKQNWRLQHNILHHTYTNITDLDDDIADKGILKLSPHSHSHREIHRFQKTYAFFLYAITTLYWIVVKDFVQYFRYTKDGVNPNSEKQNKIFFIKLVTLKTIYYATYIGLPIFLGIPVVQVLAGFLIMHFVAGIVLTTIFQMAHNVEETDFPLPDEEGNIQNDWAIHQMNTTVNFSKDNKFLSWYVGGLNYQVEHHLFSKICHIHYPAISPIVKETAEEFGVPYLQNGSFKSALKSHINFLEEIGRLPDLNDAIG